jgi:polyisoprenoid-binding protein YceI
MHIRGRKSAWATVSGIFGIAVLLSAAPLLPRPQAGQASAQEIALELDPGPSKVHYSVDSTLHTIHGTFALKSGAVHFDPESGKAGGEISVFATSGDSGNSGRDERMHSEILETAKYPDAIFRPEQIEGKVALSGASDVKVRGVILLHGQEHQIVAAVHAELTGDRWKGTAKFDVPYVQWGIKNPSNWLLKVKPVVNVDLEMSGAVRSAK